MTNAAFSRSDGSIIAIARRRSSIRFDLTRREKVTTRILSGGSPIVRARLAPVDGEIGPLGVHAVREKRYLLARDAEARERHLAARPVVEDDVVIDGVPERDHLLDALPEILDSREIEPVEVHHAEQLHDGRNAEAPPDRLEREERIVRESHEDVGLDLDREPFEPAEHDEGEENRPDEPPHDPREALERPEDVRIRMIGEKRVAEVLPLRLRLRNEEMELDSLLREVPDELELVGDAAPLAERPDVLPDGEDEYLVELAFQCAPALTGL